MNNSLSSVPVVNIADVIRDGTVIVGEGEKVRFSCDLSDTAARDVTISIGAGARVEYLFFDRGGAAPVSSALTVHLTGAGARFDLTGVAALGGGSRTDMDAKIYHDFPQTQSTQRVYAIAASAAVSSYSGRVFVDRAAQKSDARQMCRGILMSNRARIVTRPEMEIYADDVSCSHGATVGALDEQALFYLTSRGLSRAAAREMMLLGFISDAMSGAPDDVCDAIRAHVSTLLAEEGGAP